MAPDLQATIRERLPDVYGTGTPESRLILAVLAQHAPTASGCCAVCSLDLGYFVFVPCAHVRAIAEGMGIEQGAA